MADQFDDMTPVDNATGERPVVPAEPTKIGETTVRDSIYAPEPSKQERLPEAAPSLPPLLAGHQTNVQSIVEGEDQPASMGTLASDMASEDPYVAIAKRLRGEQQDSAIDKALDAANAKKEVEHKTSIAAAQKQFDAYVAAIEAKKAADPKYVETPDDKMWRAYHEIKLDRANAKPIGGWLSGAIGDRVLGVEEAKRIDADRLISAQSTFDVAARALAEITAREQRWLKANPGRPLPGMFDEQRRPFALTYERVKKELLKERDVQSGKRPGVRMQNIRALPESLIGGTFSTAASLVKDIGIAQGRVGSLMGYKIRPEDTQIFEVAEKFEKAAKEAFPGDPARQQDMIQQVMSGFGSSLIFYGPGIIGSVLGASTKTLVAVTMGTGAMAQGAEGYEDAVKHLKKANGGKPLTDEQMEVAYKAWMFNSIVGTSEALPVSALLTRSKGRSWKAGLAQSAEEGGQEVGQKVFGNTVAKNLYDPSRDIGEGVAEAGIVGAIVGGGMHAGFHGVGREDKKPSPQTTPPTTPTGASVVSPVVSPASPAAGKRPVKSAAQIGDIEIPATPVQTAAGAAVRTPDGTVTRPVEYVIVSANDLAQATGDLQPRDTNRAERATRIAYMAANLDPAQVVVEAPTSDRGPPVVSRDGVILSGNTRASAIQVMYSDPVKFASQIEAYQKAIGAVGTDIVNPVKVARFTTPITQAEAVEFADKSNRSAIAEMSVTEKAQRDSRAAGSEIMQLYQGGSFASPENAPFLRAFVGKAVSAMERGSMAKDGFLTKAGEDRLSSAVLSAAYGDPDLLSRMLESTDDNVKAITGAMRDAAGAIMQLRASIAAGTTDPAFDITPQLVEAVKLIASMRDRGIKPAQFLAQQDAFSKADPIVEAVVRGFYNEDMSRANSRAKLTDFLKNYAEEARKHSGEEALFADETTPQDVLRVARALADGAGDLFGTGTSPDGGLDAADGPAGARPATDGGGQETRTEDPRDRVSITPTAGPDGTSYDILVNGFEGDGFVGPEASGAWRFVVTHPSGQSQSGITTDREQAFRAALDLMNARDIDVTGAINSDELAGMALRKRDQLAPDLFDLFAAPALEALDAVANEIATALEPLVSDDLRVAFQREIVGDRPAVEWQGTIGATNEQYDALIGEALDAGHIRVKNGKVRRTPKGKALKPVSVSAKPNSVNETQVPGSVAVNTAPPVSGATPEVGVGAPAPAVAETIVKPQTMEELTDLLVTNGVDVSLYGTGPFKSVANLLKEINEGEATISIESGRIVRRISTLALDIYTQRDGQTLKLYEDRQEFTDGRVRRRDLDSSLGEKLKAGENPSDSIARAIEEELGIQNFAPRQGITTYEIQNERGAYPGIVNVNTISRAAVDIDPAGYKPEYVEVQPEKTNTMAWFPVVNGDETSPSSRASLERREADARAIMESPEWVAATLPDLTNDTSKQPGYGTPEWHANRVYSTPTGSIVGFENGLAYLREQAILKVREQGSEVKQERKLFILLGLPGAGKSTVARKIQSRHGAMHLVSDDAKLIIPEFDGGKNSGGVHEESSAMMKDLTKRETKSGNNIISEKLGSSDAGVLSMIADYEAEGYTVTAIYVNVPKALAMERAIKRWKAEGRAVPLSEFDATHSNLPRLITRFREKGELNGVEELTFAESRNRWLVTGLPGVAIEGLWDRAGATAVQPRVGRLDRVPGDDRGLARGQGSQGVRGSSSPQTEGRREGRVTPGLSTFPPLDISKGPPTDKPVVLMFGGSFNPVHLGHRAAVTDARAALEKAGYTVEGAIVAPTADKLLANKLGNKAYPLAERTEMARLTFAGIDGVEVSDGPGIEAENFVGKLKRTQLADWASARHPNATIVNVTGADSAPGSPPSIPSVYSGDPGTSHDGYYYLVVPRDDGSSISSSGIRNAIALGQPVPDGTMDAATVEYLSDLYRRRPDLKPEVKPSPSTETTVVASAPVVDAGVDRRPDGRAELRETQADEGRATPGLIAVGDALDLQTAIAERETDLRRPLPQVVVSAATRIVESSPAEIRDTIREISGDPALRKADALELARLLGYPPNSRTTKAQALASIADRIESLSDTATVQAAVVEEAVAVAAERATYAAGEAPTFDAMRDVLPPDLAGDPDLAVLTAAMEQFGARAWAALTDEAKRAIWQDITGNYFPGATDGSAELRDNAGEVSPDGVSVGVPVDETGRDAGGALQDDRAAGDGDVRGTQGANVDRADGTAGSRGQGGVPRKSAADMQRDRERRTRLRAVAAEAEQKRRDRIAQNYRITPDDQIGQGGDKAKVRANIEALKLLRTLEQESRQPTDDEKKILVKYVGWGAYSQAMFDKNPNSENARRWKEERAELQNLLSVDEWASASGSTLNAHYTSEEVINGVWRAVQHLGFTGGRTIEPGAGVGHFIGLVPESLREKVDWAAVELDTVTGGILKNLYQGTDVRIAGYETQTWPNDFFDLAISNVPFGDYSVTDRAYKQKMFVHDYYFVRSLDKVRPGGLVAFITSHGTLDKLDAGPRREMAKRGTFLGAIRLPGGKKGAFQANAGTDVTTDVIFFRKRLPGEPEGDTSWIGSSEIEDGQGGTYKLNDYFRANPGMMLGKMEITGGRFQNAISLIGTTENLADQIAEAAANLEAGAFIPRGSAATTPTIDSSVDTETGGIKAGAFYEKAGKIYRKVMGVGQPQNLGAAAAKKVRAFMAVRDAANKTLAAQAAQRPADEPRAQLNLAYDAFVAAYGPISRVKVTVTNRKNKKGEPVVIRKYLNFNEFKDDPDAYKVLALELYDEKKDTAEKAAIFTRDVISTYTRPVVTGPADALAVSLNVMGYVHIPTIANDLGLSEDEAIDVLGDTVFLDPKGETWRTRADYLSGDVVTKLSEAQAAAVTDERFVKNVAALEAVQPPPLTRVDIRLLLGASWVPARIYEEFVQKVMDTRKVSLTLLPGSSAWKLDGNWPYASETQWGLERRGATARDVVEAALNSASITLRKNIGTSQEPVMVIDQDETDIITQKIQALRDLFAGSIERGVESWAWEDETRALELETLYNAAFNRLVPEVHDGSHLTFPGLAKVISFPGGETGEIRLDPHRTSAIWRIISKGNTLLNHVVGSGKTFSMIMSGMEQKRLGLIAKPAYVVPNHMLEQFSREFLQAYPAAKLLIADKDSMSKDRRKEFAARAATENWDGVIITHDAFGRVGMTEEYQRQYIRNELDEMRSFIATARAEEGKGSATVKDLEKAAKRLKERLDKLMAKERKDEGITFEELGIDFLYVDEAHLFKNLGMRTRHTRVKGMSKASSQRATDMFMKIQYLEQSRPGRAAVFATGTPVSNSMAEFYTMQRYLQSSTLKEYGIDSFDAWAGTFGEITTQVELAPNGRDMREVRAFQKFVNIPELMTLFGQVADTQTAAMLNLPRPKLKGNRPIVVLAEPSAQEERMMDDLVKRAENIKGQKPEKGADNMLKIMGEGLQLGVDARLLDPSMPFNETGKVALAVDNIARIYKDGKEPAMAQIVFLDMGVPGSKGRSAVAATQGEVIDEDGEIVDDSADIENSIFAGKFELYQDIKDRLIAKGIPAEEIAFIHDANNDVKKGQLFDKVRSGKVRVLLGTTGKMGVGTNVQARLIAMHHLDAPWRPADLEQRDGRILRQGNKNPEIEIYRYITKRTLDAYRWQTLEAKSQFIAQLQAGARGVREAEDIDSPLPEAAAIKAAATDNPLIMEHAELKKKLRELEAAKRGHERSIHSARSAFDYLQRQRDTRQKSIDLISTDVAKVTDLSGDAFSVVVGVTGEDVAFTDRTAAGEMLKTYLLSLSSRLWSGNVLTEHLGTISGFRMRADIKRTVEDGPVMAIGLEGNTVYGDLYRYFKLNEDTSFVGVLAKFVNMVESVPKLIAYDQAELARIEQDMPRLEAKARIVAFPRAQELAEAEARVATIERALNPEVQRKEAEARERREYAEREQSKAWEDETNRAIEERARLNASPKPTYAIMASQQDPTIMRGEIEAAMQAVAFALKTKRPYKVKEGVKGLVNQGIARALRMVPGDIDVGILAGLKNVGTEEIGGKTVMIVEATYEDARSDKSFSARFSWDEFRSARAHTISKQLSKTGAAFLAFNRVSEVGLTDQLLTGEVWHENLHRLWQDGRLGAARDRLLAHAKLLNVIEIPTRTVLRSIGDPSWMHANELQLIGEAYLDLYATRSNIKDMMQQEAVAHMLELYSHGYFTAEQMADVQDIVDDIQNGVFAAQAQGGTARVRDGQPLQSADMMAAISGFDSEPVTPGLDMSREARLKRAEEMGFDTGTTWYHGTRAEFDEFQPSQSGAMGRGIYVSTNGTEAGDYAARAGGVIKRDATGERVLPLFVRGPLADVGLRSELLDKAFVGDKSYADARSAVSDEIERLGFTGFVDGNIAVVFDPSNIRSVNAAFDPARSDSSQILARLSDEQRSEAISTALLSPVVQRSIIAEARKILPADVTIRLEDSIRLSTGEELSGVFETGTRLLRLALDHGPAKAIEVARHEAVHVARQMSLFARDEWAALLDRAKKLGIDQTWMIDDRGTMKPAIGIYDEYYRRALSARGMSGAELEATVAEYLNQERVAKMLETWATKESTYGKTIDGLLARIGKLLEALVNGLRGAGFRSTMTADDVVARFLSGEVAARANAPATGRNVLFESAEMAAVEDALGVAATVMPAFAMAEYGDPLRAVTGQPITVRAYRGRVNYAGPVPGLLSDADVRRTTGFESEQGFVFASSHHDVANDYAQTDLAVRYGATDPVAGRMRPTIYPIDMRFENPLVIDARGGNWEELPYDGQLLSANEIAPAARDAGYDGLIVNNTRDGSTTQASTIAALRPGTVRSALTGDIMFAMADVQTGREMRRAFEYRQLAGDKAPWDVPGFQGGEASPVIIRAWHASPSSFTRFDPSYTMTPVGGGADYKGSFNFTKKLAISGPDGAWTKNTRRMFGQSHVYQVDLHLDADRVFDARKPFEDQSDWVKQTLLANEDYIRDNWFISHRVMSINGQPYKGRAKATAAELAAATKQGQTRDSAVMVLRTAPTQDRKIKSAIAILEAGAEPKVDLFPPGVTLDDLYYKPVGVLDRMGFQALENGDEIVVGDVNRMKVVERDGVPVEHSGQPLFAMADVQTGRELRRDLDSLGYYSKALEAARSLKQAKGTPEQMLAQLKSAGVKQAEIEATELDKFIRSHQNTTMVVSVKSPDNIGDAFIKAANDHLSHTFDWSETARGLVDFDDALVDAGLSRREDSDYWLNSAALASPLPPSVIHNIRGDQYVDFTNLPAEMKDKLAPDGLPSWVSPDDVHVQLIDYDPGSIGPDSPAYAQLELKNGDAERRYKSEIKTATSAKTVDDVFKLPNANARAAAFKLWLDANKIGYDTDGYVDVASAYFYVDLPPSKIDDLKTVKVRFADHWRQSGNHAEADFNIVSDASGDRSSGGDEFRRAIAEITEAWSSSSGSLSLKPRSITRDEIVKHLQENQVRLTEVVRRSPKDDGGGFDANYDPELAPEGGAGLTKFNPHSLDPSNPSYRETVLHLPESKPDFAQFEAESLANGVPAADIRRNYDRLVSDPSLLAREDGGASFRGGHFPEPNIIGHMQTSLVKHEGKPVFLLDQIQSDWGQRLRDGGVRDKAKIADLFQKREDAKKRFDPLFDQMEALARANRKYEPGNYGQFEQVPYYADAPFGSKLTAEAAAIDDKLAEISQQISLYDAELRTAEASASGHPLVNTTDQWTTTTLRRALRQAAEADADYIAIPHGDTVLTYNPGGREGMAEFYDRIVPKNLRNLLTKIDPSIKPLTVNELETPSKGLTNRGDLTPPLSDDMEGEFNLGFTLFPLTDKVKSSVKEDGQPLFSISSVGRETPQPAMRSFTSNVEGFDGTVNNRGGDGKRVRTYRLADIDGNPAAFAVISESTDGTWSASMVHVAPNSRRRGLGDALLSSIETDLGQRLAPSGWLSQAGHAYWSAIEPQMVAEHKAGPDSLDGLYLGPDQIRFALSAAERGAAAGDDRARDFHQMALDLRRMQASGGGDVLPAMRSGPSRPIDIGGDGTGDGTVERGLSDLVTEAYKAIGVPVRMGRLDPSLKAAARAAGAQVMGQYGRRTGVIRQAVPNDLGNFAHEGGHALEDRADTRDAVRALKDQHQEELTTPAMPDFPAPPFAPNGYAGVEADADTVRLLADVVVQGEQSRALVTAGDRTSADRISRDVGAKRDLILRRMGASVGNAMIADAQANTNASDPAGVRRYLDQRFARTGTPDVRQSIVPSDPALSEGWAEWFATYLVAPDLARRQAPVLYNAFEDKLDALDPDLLEKLEGVQEGYQALLAAKPTEAVKSRVKLTRPPTWLEAVGKAYEDGEINWRNIGIGAAVGAGAGFMVAAAPAAGLAAMVAGPAIGAALGGTIGQKFYQFQHGFLDRMHPLKVAVDYLTEVAARNTGVALSPGEKIAVKAMNDPYKRARLAEHSRVHATAILQQGVTFSGETEPQGTSLRAALIRAFGGTGRDQWNDEKSQDFGSYLAARRMLAEFDRFDRKELENAPDMLIQRGVWQKARDDFEQANPDFVPAADMVYAFLGDVLRWKLENGFVTQELYDDLTQRTDYVPLNRVMDDGPSKALMKASGQNKSKMIHRFLGSTRDIINPIESITQDVYATTARVALNGVIKAMVNLAESVGPGGGVIAERIPAKEMKGTTVDIRDALKAAAKQTGLEADAVGALLDMIDDMFDQDAAATIFRATDTNERGEPILYLWEGGKRVPIRIGDDRIAKDIFDTFVAMGQNNQNMIIDMLALSTQALRAGVTKSPAYVVVNYLRDQLQNWILGDAYTPFVTGGKGLMSISQGGTIGAAIGGAAGIAGGIATGGLGLAVLPAVGILAGATAGARTGNALEMNDPTAMRRYARFAGMMGGVDANLIDTMSRKKDAVALRSDGFLAAAGGSKPTELWHQFLRAMEVTEAATRIGHFDAVFQRAIADGMTREEAAFEAGYTAHDVMDFSRRGARTMEVARIIAFMNAAFQGMDVARRSATGERDTLENYRELLTPYARAINGSPLTIAEKKALPISTRMWVKMAALGLLSVALMSAYHDDDEYEEFSDQMKATHWFFKVGGIWWRFPKPFELATIANLSEAAYGALFKSDPRAFQQFRNALGSTMVPPHEVNAVKTFYEMSTGVNTFRGRPIEGQDIRSLPPEMRFNAYTSELAKMLGKATGTSPAQVDHLISSMFATVGRDVQSLSDYVLPSVNQAVGGALPGVSVTPRAEKSVEDYWFISRMSRRAARGALSTENFWKQMGQEGGKYMEAAAGYKRLYEAGRADPGRSPEAAALMKRLDDDRKAFAILETHFKERDQDLHPMNRARQAISVMSGIRKDMVLGSLVKQATKWSVTKPNREPEAIKIEPSRQRVVNEILEDLSMREARNALIAAGHKDWKNKRVMPIEGLRTELERVAPEVHGEMVARMKKGNNKIYTFESVRRLWPMAQERLLKEGAEANLSDIRVEAERE